ncbi:Insertion element protein [Nonomuraea sp. NPDC050680]|uniref:Insertion element protein n=1 Tax=Nonomuraea sp. NPDC050680 TaxID=3154630 RepID=UPI0033C30271
MTTRAVPFHCPYCGDEDLEPYEGDPEAADPAAHGGWYCRSCARAFKLKFLGIGVKI